MRLPSIFDFLGIIKPENINWHEGGRRIKIVIQIGLAGFVFLFALSDGARCYGKFYGFFWAFFVAVGVTLGIEGVFRTLVWVFRGFAMKK